MLSRFMTRREQFVLVFFACALIVGASVVGWTKRSPDPVEPIVIEKTLQVDTASTPEVTTPPARDPRPMPEIVVSIIGAVARPNVYTLDAGSRINELIHAAGGTLSYANTTSINLAARLVDGSTLIVPERDDPNDPDATAPTNIAAYSIGGAASGGESPSPGAVVARINLNTASQAQLETLPGIGPKYAAEIIRYRNEQGFHEVADLMNVSGIGPKRFETISVLVSVQ